MVLVLNVVLINYKTRDAPNVRQPKLFGRISEKTK